MRIGTKHSLRLLAHASWFSVLLSVLFIPMTVLAEQRPSIAPAATVPAVWAWFDRFNVGPSGNAALFNGYSTAVEVCQLPWPGYPVRFEPYYSYPGHPYNGITGNCYVLLGSAWAPSGQPSHYQNCPVGYHVPNVTMIFLPKLGSSAYFDANQLTCQNQDASNRCPEVAVGETPYVLDPGGLTCSRPDQCQPPDAVDPATGQCVKCPVTKLANPPFSDACSISLEASKGFAPESTCGKLSDDMIKAAACIATKINALSTPRINYTGPSATIRTAEYQDHLREVWDKSGHINAVMNSLSYTAEYRAKMKVACADRKTEVDGEMQKHAIDSQPSSAGEAAPHVERRAIDVPRSVADELKRQVTIKMTTVTIVNGVKKKITTITSDVQDYMNSKTINPSTECTSSPTITWGGRFDPVDRVHFQLPK